MNIRLQEIKSELDALYAEIKARPAAEIEARIAEDMTALADGPSLWNGFQDEICSLIMGLSMFRMTDEDNRREAKLIAEWNQIVGAARQACNDRRQAKINAREVAAVKAAACPTCFATHAGEC